ncbi:response regulator transcription factor [Streptomyces pathocidini]|uniref:response regulator transcription factor n=1 Tax=Streptomyces pathocidini TaxID=1650571 RepID=UPI0033ED466B
MAIRILIVDDQSIIRSGLRMLIESSEDFEVVAEAADGAEAITQVAKYRPDVVLMDLRMPRIDGVEATVQLMRLPDPPNVLVLSTYDTDAQVIEALQAGASGFLLKDLCPQELSSALHAVANGGRVFAAPVLQGLVHQAIRRIPIRVNAVHEKIAALSESEQRVLLLLGVGRTNAQIAEELFLSASSVKTYVSRTLAKLGLENRTQAAIIAYEAGLVGDERQPEQDI